MDEIRSGFSSQVPLHHSADKAVRACVTRSRNTAYHRHTQSSFVGLIDQWGLLDSVKRAELLVSPPWPAVGRRYRPAQDTNKPRHGTHRTDQRTSTTPPGAVSLDQGRSARPDDAAGDTVAWEPSKTGSVSTSVARSAAVGKSVKRYLAATADGIYELGAADGSLDDECRRNGG